MTIDAGPTHPLKQRHISRFSWAAVDPAVTRRLLTALYEGQPDRPVLRGLSPDRLSKLASECYGSPPKPDLLNQQLEELIYAWLPRAEVEVLRRLATVVSAGLGPAGRVELRTRADIISFLGARKRTQMFKHNLRAQFVRAHRVSSLETVHPSLSEQVTGPLELEGEGIPDDRLPYRHQSEARNRLDDLRAAGRGIAGLIVLPTGSGKTETVVDWLLDRLEEDSEARVLWLAHQQELLQQAMKRFQQRAVVRPEGFRRKARLVYAGASSLSTLAEDSLDVALVTAQTAGTRFDAKKERLLRRFVDRPTHVVVDEAHHAGSTTYERILEVVSPTAVSLVGLTATPWPSGVAAVRLRKRFPERIIDVDPEELTREGILARPVLHSIDTGQRVLLDDEELRQASASDLPPQVLAMFHNDIRDKLVVSTWVRHRELWGKTLVFATRIDHADALTGLFQEAGAPVRAVHSQMEGSRSEVLDWFRSSTREAVLVSVAMLTEGIDLPDADTAFLARPTTSRILLRQMIGRVLRGPAAGGAPEAHLVDFQDRWENFSDVLDPEEVLEVEEVDPRDPERERRLPEIVADDGVTEISDDVVAQVRRAFRAVAMLLTEDTSGPRGLDPLLVTSQLAGWYQLPDRRIAIFEHQRDGVLSLLDTAVSLDLRGSPLLSYFDDSHPPYPSQAVLRQMVDYVREWGQPPPFEEAQATIGPQDCAVAIFNAGPLNDWERADLVRAHWDRSLVRAAYPSLETFEVAVEQELRQRRAQRRGEPKLFDPETGLIATPELASRKLPRSERSLDPARLIAIDRIRDLIPPDIAARLDSSIPVEWTRRVVSTTWGHWSIKLSGKNRGSQVIRINRLLQTAPKFVSDEMLAYLIYHELLHHLFPGMGHSWEFREYEALWPEGDRLDAAFDTLHERWSTDPARYNGGRSRHGA